MQNSKAASDKITTIPWLAGKTDELDYVQKQPAIAVLDVLEVLERLDLFMYLKMEVWVSYIFHRVLGYAFRILYYTFFITLYVF